MYLHTLLCSYRGMCLTTLRGHADSVNSAAFLPFSNTLATCSADKSVSLWDIRTVSLNLSCVVVLSCNYCIQGLCIHSFYGHHHACSAVRPTFQGWEIFSGDCFGSLFSWDIRGRFCSGSWNLGHNAVNCIALDKAKTLVACATDSCAIKLLEPSSQKVHYVMPQYSHCSKD